MKRYLEKQFLNDFSVGTQNNSQEYQLFGHCKCSSPMIFGNRLASSSPQGDLVTIHGQLSPQNQSRRESAFSINSEKYDFSVKGKNKLSKNLIRIHNNQVDDDLTLFFDKEQIVLEEQETLHAKLRLIRDDYNFKLSQLEDQYLRDRQAILQNLTITIKQEQDRIGEISNQKIRKGKTGESHARTDSIIKVESKSESTKKRYQEISRAVTSMKESRPESRVDKRIESRRESNFDTQNCVASLHKRDSSFKSLLLRESRAKKEDSQKADSKDEYPLKSALKKKDSNRQAYNNDDSQDDWKFIKEAKINLEKQKTQLDDKQSPNKVRFVNEEIQSKKQQKSNHKQKCINDIDVYLKFRY